MRGKRLPRYASGNAPAPRTLGTRLATSLLAAGQMLMSAPRETMTFDARRGRIVAWIDQSDRRLFAWFAATRDRIRGDLEPRHPSEPELQPRARPRRLISQLSRDESGVTMIVTALFMTVMLTISAMAVDMGYVYLQNRKLQGLADLAAIAAAGDLDHAQLAAQRAVDADNWAEPMEVFVATGTYLTDPAVGPDKRFVENGAPRNAARVFLRSRSALFFGAAILNQNAVDIARSGVATTVEMASFSIGTRLASLQGGVANALLSALAGGNVSLSVMDYNELLGADVEVFKYLDALKTDLKLDAASFNDTLDAKVSTVKAVQTLANVVQATGASRAAAAIRDIVKATTRTVDIALGDMIDVGRYGNQDRVSIPGSTSVKANALDLVKAALELANQDRQVKLDVSAAIPGLASLEIWTAIGERPNTTPWFTVTDKGQPVIRTAQARIYVLAKIAPGLGLLSSSGASLVELPLFIELASAEARLDKVSCPAKAANRTVEILTRPSLGHVSLASVDKTRLDDFKAPLVEKPANLVTVPLLLSITGQARVDIGGTSWKSLKFTQKDIDQGVVKQVSTTDIAQTTVSSLLGNLTVEVKVLGLGLGLGKGPLETAVRNLLAGVAAPLDGVFNQLTGILGVQLGQADVRVNGLRCHTAALVL